MTLAFVSGFDGRVYADQSLTIGTHQAQHGARPQKFYDAGGGRIYTYGGDCGLGDWALKNLRKMTPKSHYDDLKTPVEGHPESNGTLEGVVCSRIGDKLIVQEFGRNWLEMPYIVEVGRKIGWFVGCAAREADALYRAGLWGDVGKIFEVCNDVYPGFVTKEYRSVTIPELSGTIPAGLRFRMENEECA